MLFRSLLKALGYQPTAYHLNEGHSAFLILERIRILMQEEGMSFDEARQFAKSTQIFTTHTPVSAGFDLFPTDMAIHYIGSYAQQFGLSPEQLLALGRENTGDFASPFSMAAFALKNSTFINGVSRLHGVVSQNMFHSLWRRLPLEEVPIGAIVNGIHARSFVALPTQELYDRYLGPDWDHKELGHPLWQKVNTIPDEELWRNRERRRAELVVFVREQLVQQLTERGATSAEIQKATEVLNPDVLTIGFARRFATYKRGDLFLYDLEQIGRAHV